MNQVAKPGWERQSLRQNGCLVPAGFIYYLKEIYYEGIRKKKNPLFGYF